MRNEIDDLTNNELEYIIDEHFKWEKKTVRSRGFSSRKIRGAPPIPKDLIT